MRTLALATILFVSLQAHAFKGKKITIDLKDAEIGNVLRLIADVSGKNVVFGEDVKGSVTLKLKQVPWDQALDVICKTKGLGVEEKGNILRIVPQGVLDTEAQKKLDRAVETAQKSPLQTRIIPVNYARAKEMADHVRAMLSPRGSVTVDERTNTLIVKDVVGSLALRF